MKEVYQNILVKVPVREIFNFYRSLHSQGFTGELIYTSTEFDGDVFKQAEIKTKELLNK